LECSCAALAAMLSTFGIGCANNKMAADSPLHDFLWNEPLVLPGRLLHHVSGVLRRKPTNASATPGNVTAPL
jgi:hypothetical protein